MASDETPKRTATATKFWASVNVEPVEIALNSGVGFTLRAYRMDNEITPADVSMREDDVDLPTRASAYDDEEEDFSDAVDAEFAEDDPESAEDDEDLAADTDSSDEEDEEEEEDEEAEPAVEPEEVPLFLTKNGQLLLFRSAQVSSTTSSPATTTTSPRSTPGRSWWPTSRSGTLCHFRTMSTSLTSS